MDRRSFVLAFAGLSVAAGSALAQSSPGDADRTHILDTLQTGTTSLAASRLAVDRALLRERVLGDPDALARLNGIVWPLMGAARAEFFERARAANADVVVLDIPLLLETGGERNVDAVVVASAPANMQRKRVLARPGMSPEKFEAILAAQMPDPDKCARAHFVVDTSKGLEPARRQVEAIMAALRERAKQAK